MKNLAILVSGLLSLAACNTQNMFVSQSIEKDKSLIDSIIAFESKYQYRIRKDDKISLSVWGQEDLSVGSVYGIYNSNEVYGKWLLVDANGNIEIPKIGTTYVLNKTLPELKDTLKKEFQKWVLNSIVDVKVLNKEITILGEVRNPGVIKVDKDQNNLLEIISRAGGTEFYANISSIKVLRQEGFNVRMTSIDLTNQNNYLFKIVSLHPGDIVLVPSHKYKNFDKRISTIIPFTTAITAATILLKGF